MVAQATRLGELHQERDRELVMAHQAGDRSAFAEIVGAHYPVLLNQAYGRLRDRAEAEDAVQETLIRAYRHLGSFGGDFRLGPWLGRILHNVCADQAHRRYNEIHVAERLTLLRHPYEADPAETFPGDDAHSEVREALGSLPPNYREAFVLRELEDLPYSEVAAITGVSEQNARARVHRARTALRRRLGSLGTGAAALLPWRWFHRTAVLVPRGVRNGRDALAAQIGSNLTAVGEAGTSGGTSGAGSLASAASQVATQIAASPATQAVLGSAGPSKSAIVIGVAATIASTTAAVMPGAIATGPSGRSPGAARVIAVGSPAPATSTSTTAPAAGAGTSTPAAASQGSTSPISTSPTSTAVTSSATSPAASPPTTTPAAPAPPPQPVLRSPWWLSVAEGILPQVPAQPNSPPPGAAPTGTDPTSKAAPGSSPGSSGTSPSTAPQSGTSPSGSTSSGSTSSGLDPKSMARDGSGTSRPDSGTASGTGTGTGTGTTHAAPGTGTTHDPSGSGTIPAPSGGCTWMVAFPGATPQQMALPPAGSFQPVGLAHTSAVQLSETGPTLMASTSTQLTGVDGGPASTVHLLYGACLPSGGSPALIVDVTSNAGGASSEVQLRGSFVQQLGTPTNAAYLFRGVVVPLNGASALPGALSTATMFVADLMVAQPYNTAKLSLVFLSTAANTTTSGTTSGTTTSGTTPTGTSGSPGTLSTAPTYSTYDPTPNVSTTSTSSSTTSTTATSGAPATGSGSGSGSGTGAGTGTAPGSTPLTSSTIPGTSTTTNG